MAGAPQTADAFLGLPRNTCARVPGLKAVAVVVDLEGPAGATREMNREELQTGVESRLRQAGITVLPRQTCPLPGVPLIYLNARVAVIDGKFAYNIDIMCLTAPRGRPATSQVGQLPAGRFGFGAGNCAGQGKSGGAYECPH